MVPKALLIGNGLNRAVDSISWSDILKEIQIQFEVEAVDNCTNYPLEFERTDLAVLGKEGLKTKQLQEFVADRLTDIHNAPLIRRFMELPVDAVLTTNYDYNLELAIQPEFDYPNCKPMTREWKHSLNRCINVGNKHIWHIHGEKNQPRSICIGYDQYCSHLSRLHECLTKPKAGFSEGPYLEHVLLQHDDPQPPWPVLFFTHDIYIVGLRLSLMEIDLWWLLSYRRRLMLQNPDLCIKNQLHYLYCAGECSDEELSLMESMGVELHPVQLIRKNWRRLYETMLQEIEIKAFTKM